ncbi:MAG: PAS domain S-box protein [Kiritimatiellae bacterium]|nr:PAS domain S-box protein [Kiritimatiellia bacterium]
MRRFADLKIKWKLTLIILLTSTLSLFLADGAFFIYDLLNSKSAKIESLGLLADVVSGNCAEALIDGDAELAWEVLASLARDRDILSAVLSDGEGNIFASYGSEQLIEAGSEAGQSRRREKLLLRSVDIARRIVKDGRVIGRLTIVCQVNLFQRGILQYLKISGLMLLLTLCSALLLSLLFQRVISHPIKRITSAAHRISLGEDYSLRVEEAGHDEIGALVETFNNMLVQIRIREEELRRHREHLEELVDQRSAVIKNTNEELRKEVWERKRAQHALVRLNEELEDRVNERTRALQDNIREMKTVRDALERERNLFTDGPVMVFKWKAEAGWPIEYVSSNIEQFAYPCEELIGKKTLYTPMIHEDDRERVIQHLQAEVERGVRSIEQDFRMLTARGEVKWVYCYIITVHDSAGHITHYDGYMLDMTERRNMQQALHDSEQRLGLALKATNDVLWDWDFKEGSLYVTQKWGALLGYDESELPVTHEEVLQFAHPDDRDYIRRSLSDHISGKTQGYEAEYRFRMKDGEYKWIMDRGRVVEWSGKNHPIRMVGTYTDITEQKVVELQISLQRALLKSMINSIPDLIFYKDMDGVYLGCNPAFCEFVGKDWDDVVGRSDYDLFDHELAEQFRMTDALMLQEAIPRINEFWVRYPDDRKVLLSTLRTPYYGPAGETLGVVGISRDVTAHRHAEQELAEKQAQLVHSGRLAALGEMSTAIAHELGQPLQIIKTSAGIIDEELNDPNLDTESLKGVVEKIKKQVQRAATIIQNVRSFARQSTETEMPARVDLRTPLADALSFFKEQFRQHQVQLDVECDENLPSVRVNAQKFQQVIVNLLSNARYAVDRKAEMKLYKYAKHVSVRMYNRKASEEDAYDCLCLDVCDNGIGMSADASERCLDPFYTTKPVGEGTGLGLSILYGIVKDFKGEVEIQSEEGEGTVFRIRIPLSDSESNGPRNGEASEQMGNKN